MTGGVNSNVVGIEVDQPIVDFLVFSQTTVPIRFWFYRIRRVVGSIRS